MAKQLKILLLFLALLLPWNALGSDTATHNDAAQLQPVENTEQANPAPTDNPNRYRIPPPTESGQNILNGPSVPDAPSEIQHHGSTAISEQPLSHYNTPSYFIIARYMPRGLTIKKLIFPFHSFL